MCKPKKSTSNTHTHTNKYTLHVVLVVRAWNGKAEKGEIINAPLE